MRPEPQGARRARRWSIGDDLDRGRRRRPRRGAAASSTLGVPDGADAARRPRAATARCRCRPTSRRRWPTPSATRPPTPTSPASVAAPTAGLHLTPALLAAVHGRRAGSCPVELVVGLGTFRPDRHRAGRGPPMHGERYSVPGGDDGGLRERPSGSSPSAPRRCGRSSRPPPPVRCEGRTELFIHGDRPFAVVDALLTNFHQPRSSLLVLVEAFVGPRWRSLYAEALGAGLPVPQLRRRHVPAGRARMTLSIEVTATDGPGPGRRDPHGPWRDPHALLHAGRHPRRRADLVVGRPGGPRGADRARQHVPPHAEAGRRRRRATRRAARLRRLVRPRAHRLRRLPGLLARARGERRARRRRRDLPVHL